MRVPRTPALRVEDTQIAARVTTEHASYDRGDVICAVARAARQGATLTDILDRTDTYLTSDLAVPLGDDRWTTPEILQLESQVVAIAQRPPDPRLTADPHAVTAAIGDRPSLSAEQRRMVEQLCGSGRRIDVVIGHAGTGKTFCLDAVREAFEASGHRVIGVAPSARAARELNAGSGIPATTAHALKRALATRAIRLRPGDVLVVDEAGMAGTRVLAGLAIDAARAEAKLIGVGDPKQLPAVDAGGLFSALVNRTPCVELVDNRRQHDPEERLVVTALRHGHTRFAIRHLDRGGRVTVATNSDTLRETMVTDWLTHREAGADVVMGAVRRADAADLNNRAHRALEATGQLGPLVAIVDDRRFCLGEQVLAGHNRYDLGLINGDLGTVTGIAADHPALRVRIGHREVEVPMDYVTDHLSHAYARTVHKTQGMTCDVALLLGDDTLYAELGYTGLTRGRDHNHLYAVTSTLDLGEDGTHDLAHVIAALEVSRAKVAAIDILDVPELA